MASSAWRGRIAFGMVSIPVRLYKAARRERIRFHHVYRPAPEAEGEELEEAPVEGRKGPRLVAPADPTPVVPQVEPEIRPVARVHHAPMAVEEEDEDPAPIPREQILKGYEIEKDRYVTFQPHEIAALRARTSTELAIDEFVAAGDIDPVFFDTSYYVEPDKGAEKPYALLFRALRDSGYAAIGALAMHGREHVAAIRAGKRSLILHTMFYPAEARLDAEYTVDPSLAGSKEVELATRLVQAMAGPFAPEKWKNTQDERLRALIESRSAEAVPAAGRTESSTTPAPAADLMEALRQSLAKARKPAQREERPAIEPVQTARRPRKK